MTALLLFGLMGKYGLKGDMAEGFKVLQLAANDSNFQEEGITTLPRSGLLEPGVVADGSRLHCCPTRQGWCKDIG
jgi:hypothetical protein